MPNVAKSLVVSLALSAVLSGCASPTVKQITILHTNDIHGRHLPVRVEPGNATAQTGDPGRSEQPFSRSGLIGGFDHLAGAIAQVRRDKGADNVLLVDGGDTFGDNLLGRPVVMQSGSDQLPQPLAPCELARLGAQCPVPRTLVSRSSTIQAVAAIAPQLAADRRRRSPKPSRN